MRKRIAFCLSAWLIVSASACAQDWFFDGSVANPGDWNEPLNWDMDTVPENTDSMVVSNVYVGNADGPLASATANITGGLTAPTIGDLRVGAGTSGGANGTLNHSAGLLRANTDKWSFVGLDGPEGNPNVGTYNLSGSAEFTMGDVGATTGGLYVGIGGGLGAGNQGTVNLTGSATMNLNDFSVGTNDANTGTLNQSGGTINANQMYVGDNQFETGGIGSFTQTSGDVQVANWLSVGRGNGAMGTYNMSGGTLTVGSDFLTVGENTGATGVMNVSGNSLITAGNIAVGRFGGGATGTLTLDGSNASVTTIGLLVGRNDQNDFNPEDVSGTLNFVADASGIAPIFAIGDVYLNDGTVIGSSTLEVDLTAMPTTGDVTIVSVGGVLDGTFANLVEGATVPFSGGRRITYSGGDGNDIVLLEGFGVVDGDFNDDGIYDCLDVDALVAQIAGGANPSEFDLTGDLLVNIDDLDWWRGEAGIANLGVDLVYLVGDADLNGVVDGLDFIEWNDNKFTSTAAWCAGDFNADGTVDGLDFIEWNENKFTSSDGFAVPEPTSGLLCWMLGCCIFGWRSSWTRRVP